MYKIIIAFLIVFISNSISSKDIIVIDAQKSFSEKKALVILNGFGDSKKNRKIQKEYFCSKGYDLFILDYIEKSSLKNTQDKFNKLYDFYKLSKYKEVSFFCYIIGGYVLNEFLKVNYKNNIKTILYDRSPIQERAAKVARDKLQLISFLIYGRVLKDFSEISFSSLDEKFDVRVGLIIENKATRLMRIFEKQALSYGPLDFSPHKINNNHDDFIHTILDHDLMYRRFDVIGNEIIHFLEFGVFTEKAKRIKYKLNPFKKVKDYDIYL
tara:strand:- start:1685 stop:2488 length:804 start_codon:yes stop_codon:yes gene_type:complete